MLADVATNPHPGHPVHVSGLWKKMPDADPGPVELPREGVAEAHDIRGAFVSRRHSGGLELPGYPRHVVGPGGIFAAGNSQQQNHRRGLPHASTAWAARTSVASSHGFATSCTASGRPCSPSPQGTLIAGQPSALNRFVRSVEAGISNNGATPG